LEQLKATLQLSLSVATAWSDGATLDCAITYSMLLHQRDHALRGVSPHVSQEEWERIHTAPFGAYHYSTNSQRNYSCGTRWPVGNETMHYTGDRHSLQSVNHVLLHIGQQLLDQHLNGILLRYCHSHDSSLF